MRCGTMQLQGVWHGLIQTFGIEQSLQDESDDAIDALHRYNRCTPHNKL